MRLMAVNDMPCFYKYCMKDGCKGAACARCKANAAPPATGLSTIKRMAHACLHEKIRDSYPT